MAKKNIPDFLAISFEFWANLSTGLRDPLGCSNVFGSSPIVIEGDKIVADIFYTNCDQNLGDHN